MNVAVLAEGAREVTVAASETNCRRLGAVEMQQRGSMRVLGATPRGAEREAGVAS